MSGGSFNFLCWKDNGELFDWNVESDMERMADRLAELGYAEDAARETTELLLMIRQAKIRIETRASRLRKIWEAVEWWDSNDRSEQGVKDALAEYRNAP